MSFASARARAVFLFVLGALVRLSFWLATADRSLPNTIAYEGDTPKWLSFLSSPETNPQLALPMHPPGMVWLTPVLTDGESFVLARSVMLVLGAMVAPLLYLLLRRGVSERIALAAGLICSVSSSLIVIGSGVHSGVPYLVLFLLGLFPFEAMRRRRSYGAAIAFGLLQALACFFRVDHLAFLVLALLWLAIRTKPHGWGCAFASLTTVALVFLPWQGHANDLVHKVNTQGFPGRAPKSLPLANALPWNEDALATVRNMPAFAREATFGFINNTIALRGGKRVTIGDLGVLDDAYGYRPEPMSSSLLSMYGPLNFALANYPGQAGGFSRVAFDHRPPLKGGVEIYSPMIRVCLEPNGPTRFDYPPHLELINDGYRIGLDRLMADPGWAASLFANKLMMAWAGVASGFGGYNAPLGMSGVREAVDITVPVGWFADVWRLALLILAGVGMWTLRTTCGVVPLALFVVAKVVAVVLFFGYARMGALCVPAFALLWAAAIDRLLLARLGEGAVAKLTKAFVVVVVLLEGVRCFAGESPKMLIDEPPLGPIVGRNQRVLVAY